MRRERLHRLHNPAGKPQAQIVYNRNACQGEKNLIAPHAVQLAVDDAERQFHADNATHVVQSRVSQQYGLLVFLIGEDTVVLRHDLLRRFFELYWIT